MADFFEYQSRLYSEVGLSDQPDRDEFKEVLNVLWKERQSFGLTSVFFDDEKATEQQFFTFYDKKIKAGKYIGSIKYGDKQFQVLPKIFFSNNQSKEERLHAKEISNRTLLWWLSRCSKVDFPKSFSSWDTQNFDFLDILVHLFASLTRDDLVFNKHQSYVEREEEIGALRGRIDFTKYASNYHTGKVHILPCVYDSLEINNLYNQIIKFTAKLLLQNTDNDILRKKLFEIIWILDEVDNMHLTSMDCERVVVSPLNDNMQTILNYCKMFLSGMSIKSDADQLEIFAFLIPTERLFEDFLFGFIRDEFQNKNDVQSVESQGDKYGKQVPLASNLTHSFAKPKNAFRLKPDIYIHKTTKDLILDSKYKVIYNKEEAEEYDRKKSGVGIGDIYQMLAYTVKLDVKTCHLLYPPSLDTTVTLGGYYEIKHHNNSDVSKVYYHRLPTIISDSKNNLKVLIAHQEEELKILLNKIIFNDFN